MYGIFNSSANADSPRKKSKSKFTKSRASLQNAATDENRRLTGSKSNHLPVFKETMTNKKSARVLKPRIMSAKSHKDPIDLRRDLDSKASLTDS